MPNKKLKQQKQQKPKIRIETWKKRKVITARDNKGRFINWHKKTKEFTIKKAKIIFSQNRSFSKTRKTTVLKNVIEVQDFSAKPSKPSFDVTAKYQYFVESIVNKTVITARSMQHDVDFPKDKARDEAFENFFARVHQSVDGLEFTGDEEEGEKIFNRMESIQKNLREGVVYYKAIS